MPLPMMKPMHRVRCLLSVGLALLACACDTSGFVEDSTEETSLRLDAAQPHVVKRLRLRAKTRADADAKFSHLSVNVSSSVRWSPEEGTRTDVLPWYRIRMVNDPGGEVQSERVFVMKPFDHHEYVSVSADADVKAPLDTADASFRLEFDRQGAPSEGAFTVTWKAYGTLYTDDGDPEDIQFTVTEESDPPAP
ncbi:hypothetical protein [Corallococcus carmarthensis]|uniref:Lipoprotein n=1 Tax=Corallococcus carmarthensis TaxID=2316728 RepID=A0A3A8KG93_9BACT|nr:hypothetical protein [Corallococcus carmarthensis]RKH07218.1 hypothetical protein D7X32_02390 [Corallococcus carmarthensis]